PLHYLVPWIIAMAFIKHVVSVFNDNFARHPLLTTMAVNGLLGGIADTVAQTITAVRSNQAHKKWHAAQQASAAVELREKSDGTTAAAGGQIWAEPPRAAEPFSPERLLRFVVYGVGMAPAQFGWFKVLERMFPMGATASVGPAVKRMVCDQVLFAPLGVATFFTAMTLAEGGGRGEIRKKLRDTYVPTLKANWMVWPAVQLVNFRVMPVRFQLPFVSTVGIAWTAYLSLTNAAEDQEIAEHPPAPIALP
ncbi:hypothetical protein TD95_000172, partial [Thielaviopsis punctulata]